MNILAIGAHPDDIEFGCGGTLIKYVDRGHRVFLMVLTEGGQGGDCTLRRREQLASQKIIGAEKVFWGGYQDTHLVVDRELITRIEAVIRETTPDFIFCHFPDDTHQDHRHLAQAATSATRNLRNVLYYEGPTTWGFAPSVYVDIGDSMERKFKALEAHGSQVAKTNVDGFPIVEMARSSANFRGIQGRVKFAEGFSPLRLFINI